MPRYLTVLLDADNTLFDFTRAEREAILRTFARFGLPATEENARLYAGLNDALWKRFDRGEISQPALRRERFRLLAAALGCRADPGEMDLFYRAELGKGCFLLPGAMALCRALKDAGLTLALVTNGCGDTQRARLSGSGLAPLFGERVFISGEMGVQKPRPEFFDLVFAALGEPDRQRTVLVGDSLSSDIRGGLACGVDTVWYNPGHLPADPEVPAAYTADTLEKVGELLLGG